MWSAGGGMGKDRCDSYQVQTSVCLGEVGRDPRWRNMQLEIRKLLVRAQEMSIISRCAGLVCLCSVAGQGRDGCWNLADLSTRYMHLVLQQCLVDRLAQAHLQANQNFRRNQWTFEVYRLHQGCRRLAVEWQGRATGAVGDATCKGTVGVLIWFCK